MKLSEMAAKEGKTYMQKYREFQNNLIPTAYKDKNGRIHVRDQVVTAQPVTSQSPAVLVTSITDNNFDKISSAIEIGTAALDDNFKKSIAATRVNRTALTETFNRFNNIDAGYLPVTHENNGNSSNISTRDTIILSQKAYFNFSIVRNIIDVMTEFSSSKIYFTGGNTTSLNFFNAYFSEISLDNLQDRFFREFWRSGNIFLYPQNVRLTKEDLNTWVKEFQLSESTAAKRIDLPLRYIILNPADIQVVGATSFVNPIYFKVLTAYEVANLKNPKNDIDQRVYDSLPSETKQAIQAGGAVQMRLDSSNIYSVFYKKQDYEAFAVPMVFPVLDDLEWKSELKKIDQTISRTVQQAILLINVGYESKDGKYCVNPAMITSIQNIFQNESVGRVLINDFTTKAQFVIPQIGDILNPQKYQIVNEDIRNGLNDILGAGSAGEKFANQTIKVKVFIGRLKQAREVFLNDFLIPEIKRISKLLGFKAVPKPNFEDIDLEDSVEWVRAVTRLTEIGVLTPPETLESIKTGRLPTESESLEAQNKHKELTDKGLYQPIVGGSFLANEIADKGAQLKMDTMKQQSGRPSGGKSPQTTKKNKPMGSKGDIIFSATKVKDNIILAQKLNDKIISSLCKGFKIKSLDNLQNEVAQGITEIIIANEESKDWLSSVSNYVKNPVDKNLERVDLLNEIAAEHGLDNYLAGILLNSIKD